MRRELSIIFVSEQKIEVLRWHSHVLLSVMQIKNLTKIFSEFLSIASFVRCLKNCLLFKINPFNREYWKIVKYSVDFCAFKNFRRGTSTRKSELGKIHDITARIVFLIDRRKPFNKSWNKRTIAWAGVRGAKTKNEVKRTIRRKGDGEEPRLLRHKFCVTETNSFNSSLVTLTSFFSGVFSFSCATRISERERSPNSYIEKRES